MRGGGCSCSNGDCLSLSCSSFAACVECSTRCKNNGVPIRGCRLESSVGYRCLIQEWMVKDLGYNL